MGGSAVATLVEVGEETGADERRGGAGPGIATRSPTYGNDANEASAGDLARAAARGEARAWPSLVKRFESLVRGIARSHGLNDADTADVSQVVWTQLLTHLDGLRDPERLAGWLATTARHESIDMLHKRDRSVLTADAEAFDRVDESADPSGALNRRQRDEALREMIGTLSSRHQRLISMLMSDPQPSYQEIAQALAMPVGSIGPSRQRCLAELRHKCVAADLTPDAA